MADDLDIGLAYGHDGQEYTTAVSTDADGDFSVSIGKETAEETPPPAEETPAEAAVAEVVKTAKDYAVPVGIAVAFVILAAVLSSGGRRAAK